MGTPVAYGPGYIGGKGCVRDTPAIAVGGLIESITRVSNDFALEGCFFTHVS